MPRSRDYQAEYIRRLDRSAERLGIKRYQVDKSPLLRDLARGHPPKYYSRLSDEEKLNVLDFAQDHPNTPISEKNIDQAKKPSKWDFLRRPWRDPNSVRDAADSVQKLNVAAKAAIKGMWNAQRRADMLGVQIPVGWTDVIPTNMQPDPAARPKRPFPLNRDAFDYMMKINPDYSQAKITGPSMSKAKVNLWAR